MQIRRADLDSAAFAALLAEHRAAMQATAPEESQHALDLDGLRRADVLLADHLDAVGDELEETERAHPVGADARVDARHDLPHEVGHEAAHGSRQG